MPQQPHLLDIDPEEPLSDEENAKKAEYLQLLAEKLNDPHFHKVEGFPIGENEAILKISDPPYYTACPNPFLDEILEEWNTERVALRNELGLLADENQNGYHREPLASDISAGKSDNIYNVHSYPTKIPPKAIVPYILHYTNPGDIVLDAFCGTGMMGIACALSDDEETIKELGYSLGENGKVLKDQTHLSYKGKRFSILSDLSPIASFIAYNYNFPVNSQSFFKLATQIFDEVREECMWMYETWHPSSENSNRQKGEIIYTVWSDVFICPECSSEMIYWDVAIDYKNKKVHNEWKCKNCGTLLSKNPSKKSSAVQIERATETVFDSVTKSPIHQIKQIPVLISYKVGKKRYEKRPDETDLLNLHKINETQIPYNVPNFPMLFKGEEWGDSWRAGYHTGITHAHHFYTKRNLWILSAIKDRISNSTASKRIKNYLDIWFTSSQSRLHRMNRYMANHNRHVGPLSGTLYISSTMAEISPFYFSETKLDEHFKFRTESSQSIISNQSATDLKQIRENSIDYIYTDPPFGGNLMYSELNFLLEFWLDVFTNNKTEAIVSNSQNKDLYSYQALMENSFKEYYRVLKPGRWITIVFHNSQHSVWNAIQEALLRAGFIVADVRTLDKKKGTTKQLSSVSIVKQDLVISAYKHHKSFEERIVSSLGNKTGAWEFIRQHLSQLPIAVKRKNAIEINPERQPFLLFDRMVAFHIQRGSRVPISAGQFYNGLSQRFVERDNMYFLPDQVPIYDKAKISVEKVEQLTLFVKDEKTTIQWLNQLLNPNTQGKPQTYQDIQPLFLRQLQKARHEQLPELSEILEQNFLLDENGLWFVPDPNKASDLEKIREKALLQEFKQYLESKGELKQFRTEAIRAGFADAWQHKDFQTIVKVADRLPETIIQEDPDLLMYYDNASLRVD